MSREIEFRVWLKNKKKMVKVKAIDFIEEEIRADGGWYSFEDIELMLGLKIYDEVIFVGDIVRIYGGEQIFGYYEFDKVKVIKELEDLVMLFNLDCGIEVINNIYENKELLENE